MLLREGRGRKLSLWIEKEQGQEIIDAAVKRLTDADVDFIIDNNGNVLVNDKDMDKAVAYCS